MMSIFTLKKVLLLKIAVAVVSVALAATMILKVTGKKKQIALENFELSPIHANVLAGYTSGVISTQTYVSLEFTDVILDSFIIETAADADLFSFSPAIKGTAYWVSDRRIEFRPDEVLDYGTTYQASFDMDRLFPTQELGKLTFPVQTMELHLDIESKGLLYEENEGKIEVGYEAEISLSDYVDSLTIEKMFLAQQGGKSLQIKWSHDYDENKHNLIITGLHRGSKEEKLVLAYQYDNRNADLKGKEEIDIPAKDVFAFGGGFVEHNPDQLLRIKFSDLLDPSQDLNGIISTNNMAFSYEIEGNQIILYPTNRQEGTVQITLRRNIRNSALKELGEDVIFEAKFERLKPAVRWVDDGNIYPGKSDLMIPFEAVALSSVDVEVIEIYASNVKQYFQSNTLSHSYDLKRVGRPIVRKTISLEQSGVANLMKWNQFQLDLSELTDKKPGAIYNVSIKFRPQHSLFQCSETDTIEDQEWAELNYDNHSYNRYYYYRGYNYRERENPCHITYYLNNSGVAKNILQSNIGFVAKVGEFNNYNFATTDLSTAEPLAGATIELYDLQQQLLASVTSEADGLAEITLEREAYMAVVQKGNDVTYLRLDPQSNVSLSHFNTSGAVSEKGFKGFIYGERGVWRPGDSLFISFMFQDEEKLLPDGHPIVFKLKNPKGKLIERMVQNSYEQHLYSFRTKTASNAPTGLWTAIVEVGDRSFTKSIVIETIKPNRLKINLDLDQSDASNSSHIITGKLNARWLHGAIAKNMDAKIEVSLRSTRTTFKGYQDYDFDDEAKDIPVESKEVFSGKIDELGNAAITADLGEQLAAPGKVIAKFKTTVFEHSGNFSTDIFDFPFHPYEQYIGMKMGQKEGSWIQTDTNHRVQLQLVNKDGSAARENAQVTIELWKVDFRWWWDYRGENLSNYVSSRYRKPIFSNSVALKNGKGTYDLRIDRPNWGRYYLKVTDPATGHSTGKIIYVSWPYWAGRSNEQTGISVLEFEADKEAYKVGDLAKITIPSSPDGRALVSIENGNKVLRQQWVKTVQGKSHFELEITEDMAPNAYVHVSMIQPHGQKSNDLPIRLYGIINLNVSDDNNVLHPQIEMAEVLAPDEKFDITVSEESGRGMTYTLAVVDEGLLDITRFKTPNPSSVFYAKEALGVSTFDLYNNVMGSQSGALKNVLGIGGDLNVGEEEDNKLDRFKPVVKYIGPFYLPPGKKTTHTLKMPYYVGSVRTMVVAKEGEAYGHVDETTPVRSPLMVLATLPRVLSPSEEVSLPVSVFAMEKNVRNATVTVETNDLFEIVGPKSREVSFSEIGEEMVYFTLKAKVKVGQGQVLVHAKSKGEEAKDEINLKVRAPNPPVSTVYNAILEPNKTTKISYESLGIQGTRSGVLEVSSIPPLNLEKSIQYLIRYPHGCLEQTTSKAFAQLHLDNLIELDEERSADVEKNIKAAIAKIITLQTSDGGFSYWPGRLVANEWATSYAGHFLLEAKKKGYSVPRSCIKDWVKFQNRLSNDYDLNKSRKHYYSYGLNQAYRLYTLALANKPNLGAMNRIKERTFSNPTVRWRLAGAYALIGQKEVAKKMIFNLSDDVPSYTELSYSYGTHLRDNAMILETLIQLDERIKATVALKKMSENFVNQKWWSTQTTAFCLLAAAKYGEINNQAKAMNFKYTFDGLSEQQANSGLSIFQIPLEDKALEANQVEIENQVDNTYFIQLTTHGVPLQGDQSSVSSDLSLNIFYSDMDGQEIDPKSLTQGETFIVRTTVRNPGNRGLYEELALTQMFPSGWEIINTRLEGTDDVYKSSPSDYRDIRDDRTLTYFSLNDGETKVFYSVLTAAYAGKYYLPTVTCEAMYDHTISARVGGNWIQVLSKKYN